MPQVLIINLKAHKWVSAFHFSSFKAQPAALVDMDGAGRGKRARMPKKRNKEEAEPSSTDWLDLTGESDEEVQTIPRKRAKQSRAAAKSKSPAQQRVDCKVSYRLDRWALVAVSAMRDQQRPVRCLEERFPQEFISLPAGQERALRRHALKAGTGEDGQDKPGALEVSSCSNCCQVR